MPSHILIIEDDPASLALMAYLLGTFGHAVLVATAGEEGLMLIMRHRPDLIICDLRLPGIDGLEVARQIKANPVLSKIPLIAVTAYAMVGDREKVLAAGFDGYIAKPLAPETFVTQIDSYLPPLLRTTSAVHTISQAEAGLSHDGTNPHPGRES